MDLSKLGRTEQVLSAAGILLFIFSFVPWFEVSIVSFSADAWSNPSGFNDWFPILLLFVYAIVLALPAFDVAVNAPVLASAVNRAFVGLVLSAFAVLLFVIQGLTYPSVDGYGGPSWGYFISLLIALAAGVQSYLGFTRQGGDFAQIGARLKASTQPAAAAPVAPTVPTVPTGQPEDGQQPPAPPIGS